MTDSGIAEPMIAALTKEVPNYAARVADSVEVPERELWAIYLAVVGKVRLPGVEVTAGDPDDLRRVVPRQRLSEGRDRYQVWRLALLEILGILGDQEAYNRTGWRAADLQVGIRDFFGETD